MMMMMNTKMTVKSSTRDYENVNDDISDEDIDSEDEHIDYGDQHDYTDEE